MPSVTLPLVGMPNRRGFMPATNAMTKDQRYINILHSTVTNEATKTQTIYAEKRPGLVKSEVEAGAGGGVFIKKSRDSSITGLGHFYQFGSVIYEEDGVSSENRGDPGAGVRSCIEAVLGGVYMYLFTVAGPTGWFLAADARTTTFTGDTHTNTTIDNVSSTTGLYVGMKITGTNIAANTRIAVISGSTITTTVATTGTSAGVTITNEQIAKIIDADFPTNIIGGFVVVNGRAYIMTLDGEIFGSDSNNPASWSASNVINANYEPDSGSGLLTTNNMIVALGTRSIQFFYDAGNSSGSVLLPARNQLLRAGAMSSGLAHPHCKLGDDIYFLSVGDIGLGVWRIRGGALDKVSDETLDGMLAKTGAALEFRTPFADLQSFLIGSRQFLLVQFSSGAQGSMICEVGSSYRWVESGFPLEFHFDGQYAVSEAGTSGNEYVFTADTWQDDGAAYTATIQMAPVDLGGGNPVRVTRAELLADTQSAGTSTFEISTDDFGSFTTIGSFDMTADKKIIHRCGYSRSGRIIPRITHAHNSAFRAWALRLNFEVGQ